MSGSKWGWAPPGGNFPDRSILSATSDRPYLPDLPYVSSRVRHQNVTLDELGRMSASKWGWAPPDQKLVIMPVIAGDSTHYSLSA
jgi:hypothetical protein